MAIKNNPEMFYIEDGCYSWTFDAPKVKEVVESLCNGKTLNLFAGKNKLDIDEVRVDLSNEFKPDYNMNAQDYLQFALDNNWIYDNIVYDPPWNKRKSKEFYNGNYIGQFTKLKNNIAKILKLHGQIISIGYELSNFGKSRGFELSKVYVINSFGEIRPYFISVETKIKEVKLELLKPIKNNLELFI